MSTPYTVRYAMVPADVLSLPATEVKVYTLLATYADPDGLCWPTIQTLARLGGCSRHTIMRGIARLVERGILCVLDGAERLRLGLRISDDQNAYRLLARACSSATSGVAVLQRQRSQKCDTEQTTEQTSEQQPAAQHAGAAGAMVADQHDPPTTTGDDMTDHYEQPDLTGAVPAPRFDAGLLVQRWWAGYRDGQHREPWTAIAQRARGQCGALAKASVREPDQEAALVAAYDAGHDGSYDVSNYLPRIRDPKPSLYQTKQNFGPALIRRQAAASGLSVAEYVQRQMDREAPVCPDERGLPSPQNAVQPLPESTPEQSLAHLAELRSLLPQRRGRA